MSGANTTFIAEAATVLKPKIRLPEGFRIEATTVAHETQLAALWFAAYPPEIATDLAAAQQEMTDMFAGEYGTFWSEASPLFFSGQEIVAAICTVVKAPWERTPTCPFIVDLMVRPDFRKRGLAAYLMQETARVVQRDGKTHVALRVLVDNRSAIALYRKLGFVDWDGELFAPAEQ